MSFYSMRYIISGTLSLPSARSGSNLTSKMLAKNRRLQST